MRFQSLVVLLIAGLAFQVLRPRNQEAPRFKHLSEGLYSLTQWWQPIPGLLYYPVSVFIARQEGKWVLVDAGVLGTQRQPHAAQLLAALQATVPAEEKLAAILVSHHHPDHTGALPLLLEAFPDTPVAFYEDERPFLLGNKTFAQPGSLQARLFRWIGLLGERPFKARSSRLRAIAGRTGIQKACLRRLAVPSAHLSSTAFTVGISPWTTRHPAPLPQVPASRAHVLEEPLADLSVFGVDHLIYIPSPGHSPGHISLLHHPSRTLLAVDGVSFIRPSLRRSSPGDANDTRVVWSFKPLPFLPGLTLRAEPHIVCQGPECERERAEKSFCLLADAMEYRRVLASHDLAAASGGGWTQPCPCVPPGVFRGFVAG
ncbi:hypothetical protein CHLNCDRAFT_52813 [Chlorella variabilis]|uniref:Metallo-beta-lactamase domain-containing protein n=1 Tax=Chlorella variabilis TaxID=554065 RepID=E1ZH20_CHLVA|nr:hypothetical protein CHLNCDRAFT_52813 [Chlorella variabilis]EFN55040.1 hypothetical protein CHLNCDRAFT_52813 [Chlorella variabilis]|eukprot:XP_005847142.1 hypothetical protein CHLNCDRAFT_52813 [Chlorella variabilis]